MNKYILSLFTSLLTSVVPMLAQNDNRLIVPDVKAVPGTEILVPVLMENASDVVAVQFTITAPEDSWLSYNSSNRITDHDVSFSNLTGNDYICMILSPTNAVFSHASDTLLVLRMNVNDTFEEGSVHPFYLKDVVLTLADGGNCLTEAVAGKLTVLKRPDYCVLNVQTDKTSYQPSEQLTASWQVQNVGQQPTVTGWQEELYLVHENPSANEETIGNNELYIGIGSSSFQGTLEPDEVVSRTITVELPTVVGMSGNCYLEVRLFPLSGSGESEQHKDNNKSSSATVNVEKQLWLDVNSSSLPENYPEPYECLLTRSGDDSKEQVFTITHTADSRVTLPTSVTIPAGQSGVWFYIQFNDNIDFDGDHLLTITAQGNDYPAANAQLLITDDELAKLSITSSKTDLNEGDQFQLTITTNHPTDEPIVVELTSENTARFNLPNEVTIPAGESSVTVDVSVVNDNIPAMPLSNVFRVSAQRHQTAEVIVILQDDDMPELQLNLTPTQVSEGDGLTAVTAQLRRIGKTDNRINIHVSDDSNGQLYLNQTEFVMESGVESLHFNLGPIDNPTVDGQRTFNITASVHLSDCSCNVTSGSLGSVTAQLQVIDDDGPTLSLTSPLANVKEGQTFELIITRNTDPSETVEVNLNSDHDDFFENYNHIVTIPAGQTSVTIQLTAKSNQVAGDSQTVVFTTATNGFNSGTCYLALTDQTLPDPTITLQLSADEAEIGAPVTATITVTNKGVYPMPAGVDVCFYSYNKRIYLQTSRALDVGESEQLNCNIIMPETIGTASFYASVNETASIAELNASNNRSATIYVSTKAPYTVDLAVEKPVLQQGESVQITGQLSGNRTANQPIEIYVINEGVRLTKQVKSDGDGRFSLTWQPYATQSGHFIVGACYPGENFTTELGSFNIYGIQRTDLSPITCQPLVGETFNGNISLSNPGNLGLTSLKVEVLSVPENCTVHFELQDAMTAGSSAVMHYTLLGAAPSPDPTSFENIDLRITSSEGARLEFSIGYYCRPLLASIIVTPQQLTTTMIKGQSRDYPIKITNVGKGTSGPISLSLPSWMSCATGENIASLEQNDTATIILRFTPTNDMQLNVHKTGQLGINLVDPSKGNGTFINYDITPVSEAKGTLVVDVTDENTYYTAEAPHLAGASIEVRNPVSDTLVASGTTNDSGLFFADIPEGYYRLKVTADGHDSYNNIVIVDPGTETVKVVCLSIQAITIDMKMEETEFEDIVDIVTSVKFETNVPVPVIQMDFQEKINANQLAVGESLIFNVTLTNTGLIAGKNVQLFLPEPFGGLRFEALGEYSGLKLVPQQSVVIPVRVTRITQVTSADCFTTIGLLYYWDCGNELKSNYYTRSLQVGSCSRSTGSFAHSQVYSGYYGGIGGWGSPNGFYGNSYSASEYAPLVTEITDCHDIQVGDNGEIIHTVCATISLQFSQKMTMTRQAFRGTLTIYNGNDTIAMRDVKLHLVVKDENEVVATSHEFEIHGESINGFTGDVNITSGWTLGAKETGVATVMFIPSKYAAPEVPKNYSFGGTVTYIDPFSGLEVTRDLSPVIMTVRPTAELDLTYFMQRDVFADDPLTPEVETSQLAEFSLLLNNIGYGEAKNVQMVTNQPVIVDNQKDLDVKFSIISSQLNGGEANLALGLSIPTDFGTLEPHATAYAQWWFESSLLGHFTEYDVHATHVTSFGNPDLSLLNEVTIHELIRSIKVKDLTGFAANDIEDNLDAPDKLYLSDGSKANISIAASAQIERINDTDFRLVVTRGQEGWNYGRLTDPTHGRARLQRIRRMSDGAEINLRNFWQTDRTMHDHKVWDYEYNLHFIDELMAEETTYELVFEPTPEEELEVASIEGVPAEDTPIYKPLEKVWVNFNKPIDPSTFDADDLNLNCQGVHVDAPINVTAISATRYELDLSQATTTPFGYYVLTVQTSDITDTEGYTGSKGAQAAWTQLYKSTHGVVIEASEYGELIVDGVNARDSSLYVEVIDSLCITVHPDEGFEDIHVDVWSNDSVEWYMEGDQLILPEITDSTVIKVTFELSDSTLLGDVDLNKRIDITDVVKTVNHILGHTPQPFYRRLADVNSDGDINVADLVGMVAIITGPEWKESPTAGAYATWRSNKPRMIDNTDFLTATSYGNLLEIDLHAATAYTAFQFTLSLPEGMDISDILLSDKRTNVHQLAYARNNDGSYVVLAYAMNSNTFIGNDGNLLRLHSTHGNISNALLSDILFVTPEGSIRRFDSLTSSSATGISEMKLNRNNAGLVYDILGRKFTHRPTTPGLYIHQNHIIVKKR
ncbi:MAG: DUF5006 domain-containing protein [Bacteroidaceae bacterium]|nr:DUF5006 domain-containing protein [Bacteroidaceae bacterium]